MRLGSVPSCSAARAHTSQKSSSPVSKYHVDGPRASGVITTESRPSHTWCSRRGSIAANWLCPNASECSSRVNGSVRPGLKLDGRHTEYGCTRPRNCGLVLKMSSVATPWPSSIEDTYQRVDGPVITGSGSVSPAANRSHSTVRANFDTSPRVKASAWAASDQKFRCGASCSDVRKATL